ncbi:putative GATA transcription factor 22 [Neltuma alba]|uniref:putative GATA transcription factor 22 n=1 Tax=Neltuma alba TaxID=207710 RepID=UPI0010A39037|nr:putative GATA transcription factor 22 [Prosopis alba]
MIPTYRCSPAVSSSMSHQSHIQPSSSSSYPPDDPHHDQSLNRLQTSYHQDMIPDADQWKKEDKNDQVKEGSSKWKPSKMRMMVREQSKQRFEDHHHHQKPLSSSSLSSSTDHNNMCNRACSSDQTSHIGVRVCADCQTTKTPLWRSGPTGPKSLCNACGIRQRKARLAMAAAASAPVRENKVQKKQEKKPLLKKKKKKKRKLGVVKPCGGRKKPVLEDFATRLSKSLSAQQVLFPQDEKEAAILLMALSCGLVRG